MDPILAAKLDAVQVRTLKAGYVRVRKLKPFVCEFCGQAFKRPEPQRFCGKPCRMKWEHARRAEMGLPPIAWKGGISKDRMRYNRRQRAKNPERFRVADIFRQAIKSGRIVRPLNCSLCGVTCKPHGHHEDYSQPLVVRWLCRPCHLTHHTALRRAQRAER